MLRRINVNRAAAASILVILFIGAQAGAHTPHDKIVGLAVSPDYSNDRTLLCGMSDANSLIMKSIDGGVNWFPSQIGLPHSYVTCIRMSPGFGQDGIAFASTLDGLVLKSIDAGASWDVCNSGLTIVPVHTMVLSPSFQVDQTLFIGTGGDGVFKSIDGGTTWVACLNGLNDKNVHSIELSHDYANDQTLFVGTKSSLLKSVDGGSFWFDPAIDLQKNRNISDVVLSPAYSQDQTLFVSTWGDGVVKSVDGGATWERKHMVTRITNMAVSPDYASDQEVFIATSDEILRSADGGDTWTLRMEGLDDQAVQTNVHYFEIVYSPEYGLDRTLFLASWEGVHKSTDGGDLWNHLQMYGVNVIRGLGISPDFVNDNTLFAAAYGGGVYRSSDRGDTWEAVDTGLPNMYLRCNFAFSPAFAQDGVVFAPSSKNGYASKSTLGGGAWFKIPVDPAKSVTIRALATSPDYANDQTVFIGCGPYNQHAIYKSQDGGATFTPVPTPFKGTRSIRLLKDYPNNKTIFAANRNGIRRSYDDGVTWYDPGVGIGGVLGLAISPAFATDQEVFIALMDEGLMKSTDGGDTYSFINNGIDDLSAQDIALSPGYAADRTVFAATKSSGFFKSTDGGDNWSYSGLKGVFIRSVSVSPDFVNDRTIYLAAWGSVYRSVDGGSTWDRLLDIHRFGDDYEFIDYTKNWQRVYGDGQLCGSSILYSGETDADCTFPFVGDSITWIGARGPTAGIADLYIDGAPMGFVDLYAPQYELRQNLFSMNGLGASDLHEIRIVVTGNSNPSSTGKLVFVDAFEVLR